ncbi:MAG: ACP phosphodiesterase [Bacteroidia bacterium]|nr:ACP phosphodiesterase [Bacteroidia bacterium]MDW8016104.1 ACP phosphodiesterase [Bacteroidia bacterium]
MHHLGHLYVAEGSRAFRFGAFIADGVRSPFFKSLPSEIQRGVRFHRWVDWQTDSHPAFKEARRLLRPAAGRYAGLIVDLWLDVALGETWSCWSSDSLTAFEEEFRTKTLPAYRQWAPPTWQSFIESIEKERLLLRFASADGMKLHLQHFIQRKHLPLDYAYIIHVLQQEAVPLNHLLRQFWEEAHTWRYSASAFALNS